MSLCFCGVNSLPRNDYLPHRCKQKKKKTQREAERETSWFAQNYCNEHQCLTERWGNKELKAGKCTWEWMWPFPRLLEGKRDFPRGCGAAEDGWWCLAGGLSCRIPGIGSSVPTISCPKQDPLRATSSDGLTWLGFPGGKLRGIKASSESLHEAASQHLLHPWPASHPTSPKATFQATFK